MWGAYLWQGEGWGPSCCPTWGAELKEPIHWRPLSLTTNFSGGICAREACCSAKYPKAMSLALYHLAKLLVWEPAASGRNHRHVSAEPKLLVCVWQEKELSPFVLLLLILSFSGLCRALPFSKLMIIGKWLGFFFVWLVGFFFFSFLS